MRLLPAGTGTLTRLALRRDRVQLTVWLLALAGLQAVTVSSTADLYPTEAERVALSRSTAANPAAVVFNGIVSGTSLGAVVVVQSFVVLALAVALMSTFTVVRHTRADEEAGRAELAGAGAVHRAAALIAALIVAVVANLAVAVVQVAVLVGMVLPLGGSMAFGAALVAVGVTFAALAGVVAQVVSAGRTANGACAALVGLAFLLRSYGDATGRVAEQGTRTISGWASWLSPIGWGQQVRAFDDDLWPVLAIPIVVTGLLVPAAFVLRARRDLGAGLVPERPGPAVAGRGLQGVEGLARRLQRGSFLGWLAAVVLLGAGYGAIGKDLESLLESSQATADLIEQLGRGGSLVDAYFATTTGVLGFLAAAYAVSAVLRTRFEEARGHAEPVLAASVSRYRFLGSHLTIAAIGSAVLLAAGGATTGIVYDAVTDAGSHVASLTGAALVQWPACLVLAGTTALCVALFPRFSTPVAWSALAVCLLIAWVGVLLGLPDAVLDVSPFTHLPAPPAEDVTAAPVTGVTVAALALLAAGALVYRRRDLTT